MEIPESQIFQEEVLRYLGYRGAQADERVASQITLVAEEAEADINAKNIFGVWDCQAKADTVTLGEMNIKSRSLACHLKGCGKVVLLAATLGTEADTLLRRYSALDMEKALIAQAVCTAMIERYCDTVVLEAAKTSRLDGLNPTTRFSPGYGDFEISWQEYMLKLLNAKNRIAVTLTDGYMLIPSKSVTAVVGFGKEKTDRIGKCASCANTQCEYRRVN
jgi:cobalamin-dependent methionine synthase I